MPLPAAPAWRLYRYSGIGVNPGPVQHFVTMSLLIPASSLPEIDATIGSRKGYPASLTRDLTRQLTPAVPGYAPGSGLVTDRCVCHSLGKLVHNQGSVYITCFPPLKRMAF